MDTALILFLLFYPFRIKKERENNRHLFDKVLLGDEID